MSNDVPTSCMASSIGRCRKLCGASARNRHSSRPSAGNQAPPTSGLKAVLQQERNERPPRTTASYPDAALQGRFPDRDPPPSCTTAPSRGRFRLKLAWSPGGITPVPCHGVLRVHGKRDHGQGRECAVSTRKGPCGGRRRPLRGPCTGVDDHVPGQGDLHGPDPDCSVFRRSSIHADPDAVLSPPLNATTGPLTPRVRLMVGAGWGRPYGFDPFLAPSMPTLREASALQTSIGERPRRCLPEAGIVEDVLDDGPGIIREEQGRTFVDRSSSTLISPVPTVSKATSLACTRSSRRITACRVPGCDAVSLQLHGPGTRTEEPDGAPLAASSSASLH